VWWRGRVRPRHDRGTKTAMTTPAIELRGVRKSFDGFPALSDAHFVAFRREVHGLLGENGAGKSSLMNIAAGLYAADAGTVAIDGNLCQLSGPREAAAHRIGMVHQHFKLVKRFTVAENVYLSTAQYHVLKYRRAIETIRKDILTHASDLGFTVDPDRAVGSLSIAEQQRIEIVKVLMAGAEILILDEPTAVLTDEEAKRLLRVIRAIAQKGAAVVLVTHKLAEVKNFADRITVMRAGRTLATVDPQSTSLAELTLLTVGSTIPQSQRSPTIPGGIQLSVENLECARSNNGRRAIAGLTFRVRGGEIYGIAGVGGNGQTELAEVLMGVRDPDVGAICLANNHDVTRVGPGQRRALGFASIPADRHAYGLANDLSIIDNFAIGRMEAGGYGSSVLINTATMRADTSAAIEAFDIQGVRRLTQRAGLLSGGNAQKLVIAREFSRKISVVVAHSPSRGLDVRACAAVHGRLLDARAAGAAVVLISEDLDEVLSLSDRVAVMTRGRIVAEFDAPADRQAVGRAMVDHE
jgi:general nucleoside transport system ATP-binding protein